MNTLPNILMIFTDQHRAQAMSCAGDRNIITPNLDRLAEEGIRFTRAYTNSPLCSPARATLYTGKYPSSHGAFALHVPPHPGQRMLQQELKALGYYTCHYGKWHICGGAAPSHFASPFFRPGWDEWKGWENSNEPWATKYAEGDFPLPVRTLEGYQTDALTDMSVAFIKDQPKDRPWFQVLSIEPPHDPNTPPEQYVKMFEDHQFDLRENVPEGYFDDPEKRKALVGYYGQIKNIDDNIGRIVESLEETGQLDRTIILYFADHGDMMGSHGKRGKSVSNVESSKIPLIARFPELIPGGRVSERHISMVDILPTVLGLLETAVPDYAEGIDMSDVMTGNETSEDMDVLIQFERNFYGVPNEGQIYRALASDNWLYTYYLSTGEETLFDLEDDPCQMTDLLKMSGEKALVAEKLHQRLENRLEAIGDDFFARDSVSMERW